MQKCAEENRDDDPQDFEDESTETKDNMPDHKAE